ncbi:hypothetical protein EB796_024099 [Bugula neritina]|uniref:Methylthioribose-1-phosphate isomerase n=1 Tax=Bugula neritina TaxID=10212 RepID=A0A7J7IWK1_BUGNE|nr:hypothetical protein EB796_024099 [Bugula neritina]
MSALQSIKYSDTEGLEILDQLLLPLTTTYIKVHNVDDGYRVIKSMQVRGAPAIAIVGMLSLAVELKSLSFTSSDELISRINQRLSFLVTSRPTAVNLAIAIADLRQFLQDNRLLDASQLKFKVIQRAVSMLEEDVASNKAIGKNGCEAILKHAGETGTIRILTHCNTGSLATAGYGTALGVIRSLHEVGKLERVYCTETRPYNQGARLTAYELVHEGIPSSLICDSMAALLMERKDITAVVVGADRIAANGDTANKIGTFQLAIVAKHFGVPFFIAATLTAIDMNTAKGEDIEIEFRPAEELANTNGVRTAAPGISCWNPAFDVTPASHIKGIVTEKGVVSPDRLSTLFAS